MEYRPLALGIGEAVAKRTVLRKKDNGEFETWADVAERVALGNVSLVGNESNVADALSFFLDESELLEKHIAKASLLMSGRHLQHGDKNQKLRNQEVFTNCSTASASFLSFYLLLNGSGVGRAYDDDLMIVDWGKNMPFIKNVLDESHPDFKWGVHESKREALKKYSPGTNVQWHTVKDTREGWAEALEIAESMTYEGKHSNTILVLDWSEIRAEGTPIKGMQNRPASGPVPTMTAMDRVASLKGSQLPVWEQTMWIDHYMAESVLVGGARRSARIATKIWSDPGILGFVDVKQGGFLWSANNSVAVDEDFWKLDTEDKLELFEKICHASYYDGTGEPGFINQHKLVQNDTGLTDYSDGKYAGSQKYQVKSNTEQFLGELARVVQSKKYTQITNPCGEITLNMLGGYCVIADVVPYFADSDDDAEEAFRVAARALMRTNTMDSLYHKETARTNRIGVGMTGIHEYAWKRFGLGFRDLIDESKSKDFWDMLARFKRAVDDEASSYAKVLGVNVPHTNTTIKPAGTTSKLFALSEGAHLPAMLEYLRWVQFRNDDPLVEEYRSKGYPIRELKTYQGSTIIGFPTQPEICKLGMGDKLVTAGNATPEEQYQWLMLIEKYWIHGVDKEGNALESNTGNQVSYTLKYKPELVDYDLYKKTIKEYQSRVRCCSVMPQIDATAYEYQPEEPITREKYEELMSHIESSGVQEDIDKVHIDCDNGACPVDFYKNE
jgi:adenosylcobalamin-dependent ribonucleoside-triphosphate reductase